MTGPTLTMAVAVDSSAPFHRSHSCSELFSLTKPSSPQHQRKLSGKSLPVLPFEVPDFDSGSHFDSTLFLPDDKLSLSADRGPAGKPVLDATTKPAPANPGKRPRLGRSNTLTERTRSWLPTSKSASNVRDLLTSRASTPPAEVDIPSAGGRSKPEAVQREPRTPRSVSDSVTHTRNSWLSDTPSSSPGGYTDSGVVPTLTRDKSSRKGYTRFSKPSSKPLEAARRDVAPPGTTSRAFSRASIYITKMKQAPSNMLGKLATNTESDISSASSATSLAPPIDVTEPSTSKSTSISDLNSTTDASSLLEIPQTRRPEQDPLLPVFKNLDLEITKLKEGTAAPLQWMHSVKSALLPFLQQYAHNESFKRLHPVDIEQRALVLNKWWTLLLDLLESLGAQPTPGIDKVSLMEALSLIMMRGEWRQATSCFLPLVERSPSERVAARVWPESAGTFSSSTDVTRLTESAEHSVRTMFIANLVRQMDSVVAKMSQRHVPVGLVNFCGKACAYAFFFAPGVADILVRLWTLNSSLLQRVADEFRLPRRNRGESEDIVALFPPALGSMGWSSVSAMAAALKSSPEMTPALAKINWHSPWIGRWRGQDTDLFFIFCKYYHILATEFMPSGLPLIEKARAPAFVIIHSQVLSLLDTTIHRQAALQAYALDPITAGLEALDTSATAMPGLPADLFKSMAENRLVVLLKDILSETAMATSGSRHTFAEAFMALMQAAAKKTSQFNYNACQTLCDFLEETLMLYNTVDDVDDPTTQYADWGFWFRVCKLILESVNTMLEMRVLCLIYTIWDAATKTPQRKEALCMDWLLSEHTFYGLFNHWCPMVRAYFMRLLCWRVCRDAGSASTMDREIFLAVSSRLKAVWAHYLYLKADAGVRGSCLPSSAPCYPAPGKKFMIIRTEVNVPPANMFMGFDTIGRLPALDGQANGFDSDDRSQPKPDGKRRWSLLGLGKVMSLKGDPKGSDDDLEQTTRVEEGPPPPPPPPKSNKALGKLTNRTSSPFSESPSRPGSPLYDAPQYIFRFILNWYPPAAIPPVDRILTRPCLPSPAQSWVSAHRRGSNPPAIPAGLPSITRRVSGAPHTGLINEARNANPLSAPEPAPSRTSMSSMFSRNPSETSDRSVSDKSGSSGAERPSLNLSLVDRTTASTPDSMARRGESATQPIKPTGVFKKNAVYTGRALAEWSVVVHECNIFVERRRDEGVLGLSEVEVPTMTLDGYRKVG